MAVRWLKYIFNRNRLRCTKKPKAIRPIGRILRLEIFICAVHGSLLAYRSDARLSTNEPPLTPFHMDNTNKNDVSDQLMDFRQSIDLMDESLMNLLAERMRIVRKIAAVKHAAGLPFFMPDRWEGLVANRVNQGKELGMDAQLILEAYTAIHDGGQRMYEAMQKDL